MTNVSPASPGLATRVLKKSIRSHYDLCSGLYARLWGEHLHHGYWEQNESVEEAQVRLIERLAQLAEIPRHARVLDAGCGLGGSSIWLAKNLDCRVTGITLSPVQAREARQRVKRAGVEDRVTIEVADLEDCHFRESLFDAVWSVECTEHLENKAAFIRKAAQWLRPGGRMAFCAWTKDDAISPEDEASYIKAVCRDFLCPSLGSPVEYSRWMSDAGLSVSACADWTRQTEKTWEICIQRTRKWWVRAAAWIMGKDVRRFVSGFPTILGAYKTGAMKYTAVVGYSPTGKSTQRTAF